IRGCLIFPDETLLMSFTQDLVAIEPGAVIADFDDNGTSLVIGVQMQASRCWLSNLTTSRWRFKAMVEGIAHEMQERIPDLFHDRFIEFSLFARNSELHLFP